MIDHIRQSLELSKILTATVTEVRAFLGTDRVKVYRFHEDGSGEVVAEAIHKRRLPSLLAHNFPAEDIPAEARELFLKLRQRSIVDVTTQQIGVSPLDTRAEAAWGGDIRFRSVDPCHVEYLLAMGVRSSLVVPILDGEQLWGLLVSHHSQPRQITASELQVVQLVADQVAIAIAQSNLLNQTRLRAMQEATINQVSTLLYSPETQLQAALEETVAALNGCGGRLYITVPNADQSLQLFTCGHQPLKPERKKPGDWIEQHPHWQTWLEMEETTGEAQGIWAISDLYQAVMPSDLATAFLSAPVRGMLIVQLQHRQQTLGYLSILRSEIDVETIWAGRIDRDDPRQLRPRQSFETWRELKRGQSHPWTTADLDLAKGLGNHFAVAIYQGMLYRQIRSLNADLKRDIHKRKQAEIKISMLNTQLEQRVLERTAELEQANAELVREMAEREQARVERQQAEASLERLSWQNQLILNSAGEGIYGLDSQGKITFANPAAARMLGYEVEQLIGQWMHTLLNHSQPDWIPYLLSESPIYQTLRDGTVQNRTGDLFWRQDGSVFPVDYVSSPIREQDKIVGAVVVFKDITERQLVEQMKDEFISVVSHELRTPLTSILSTLGLLSSGWLKSYPDKSQRMLEIAVSNTNRLVRLISDILDVERIKFGKMTMEPQHCNAADLMLQSVDAMRALAEKTQVTLAVTPISINLWVDPDRIIQTFTNLLNNAIKFSPPQTTVRLTGEIHPGQVIFRVKDEGIGIPEDKLETIFDRFAQVDASNSRSQGGTGLGLTICRGIIQQHGGQIWAESKPGEGSTFCLTLPLDSANPEGKDDDYDPADLDH
jgi:PAS domain S-box-containing protein